MEKIINIKPNNRYLFSKRNKRAQITKNNESSAYAALKTRGAKVASGKLA
jgi:hypothetical protein